jgi:hypothetical protein
MVVVSQQILEFFFLAEKCLITISNGKLEMHDLLQEMAFEIVRQESIKELGKRSRLWSPCQYLLSFLHFFNSCQSFFCSC